MKELKEMMGRSFYDESPVFVTFLALCPLLGASMSFNKALGMGFFVLFVLSISNVLISLFCQKVPEAVKIPVSLSIIAMVVTLGDMAFELLNPDMHFELDPYIPLVALSCLLLIRGKDFASQSPPAAAFQDGVTLGVTFLVGIGALGLVRELLSTGTIVLLSSSFTFFPRELFPEFFGTPPGAFVALGLLAWGFSELKNRREERIAAEKEAGEAKK